MITIHLCVVHYQMAIVCDIGWAFASMTVENIWDHQSVCKGKYKKEWTECKACEAHRKVQKSQDSKKELKSHKLKKASKSQEQKGASQSLESGEHESIKDADKKCWAEYHSVFLSSYSFLHS